MAELETDIDQQVDQEQPPKLKVSDFAAKIKAKYPQYKDMDDTELTNRIISKYPVYKSQVDFSEPVVKKKEELGGQVSDYGSQPFQSPYSGLSKSQEEDKNKWVKPPSEKQPSKLEELFPGQPLPGLQTTDVGANDYKGQPTKGAKTAAGVYNSLVSSLANYFGGVTKTFVQPGKGFVPLGTNPNVSELSPEQAEKMRKDVVDFIEKARSPVTTKEQEADLFKFDIKKGLTKENIGSVLMGLPALALNVIGTPAGSWYFEGVNEAADELANNPNSAKLSDAEKSSYIHFKGALSQTLMLLPFGKLVEKTGLTKLVTNKVFNEVVDEFAKKGIKATTAQLEKAAAEKINTLANKTAQVGLNTALGIGEGATVMGAMEAANEGSKLAMNKIVGKKIFDEKEIHENFWNKVLNGAAQGGLLVGAMKGMGGLRTGKAEPTEEQTLPQEAKPEPIKEEPKPTTNEQQETNIPSKTQEEPQPQKKQEVAPQDVSGRSGEEKVATKEEFNDAALNLATLDLEDSQVRYPKVEGRSQNMIGSGKDYNLYLLDREKLPESGAFEISIQDDNGEPIGFIRGTKSDKTISINLIHLQEENRGKGIGTDIYEKLLNEGYTIKSDKEITDDTYSLYDRLASSGYEKLVYPDGRIGLRKLPEPTTKSQPQEQAPSTVKEQGGGEADLGISRKEVTLPSDEGKTANTPITTKGTYSEESRKAIANNKQEPKQKEKKLTERLSSVDIEGVQDPYDRVLHYFANKGKIHPSAIQQLFGTKGRTEKSVEGEKRSHIGLLGKNAPTIDQLAHQIWEDMGSPEHISTMEIRDAVENAILSHNNWSSAAKELTSKYDYDAMYERYMETKQGQDAIEIAEKLSDEEINHILELDSQANKEKELDDYIASLQTEPEKPTQNIETKEPPPVEPPTETIKEGGGEEGGMPERRFTKQMLRSDEVSDVSKGDIAKTLNYTRQTNEMSLKEANDVIDKVGLEEAQNFVINDGELKPVVRVTLGQILIKKYDELATKAETPEDKNHYYDKAIQTANFVTEKLATEAGQQIQAFSMWSRLSPEGQLRAANQDMARQGKEKLERRKKDIKVISDKFQKANEDAANELTKSEGVKKAVEKTESNRVKKAKDKIAAAKKKRENIIKKYKGDKGKGLYSSPTGLTTEGIEFVGDLVKTYVDEGIAKLEIVVDKVLAHLKEVSGKVPNDEVRKNVTDIVQEHITKKENQKITEGLSGLEKEINKIVREHYTVPEEAKKTLVEKFIEKTGLEKEDATQLAKDIETEFDKIATRKKRNILYNEKARFDKINKTLQSGKKAEPKTVQDELIKYSNLGAFEGRDFNEMIAHKFGLGELTPEQAAKLLDLSKKVQKAPEGSPKNAATEDLLAYRANLRGTNLSEVAQAAWYANILSGYKTHEKNVVSTFFNSMGELGAEMAKDPKAIPYILGGYLKGISKRGFVEAKHTLTTGRSPIHIKKIETPTTLERKQFIGGGFNPANWFKYVTRLMVAEDVLSFQGLKEARAYQLARKEAATQGFNTWSKKGWDKVNEILYHTKERLDEATQQAESEGLKGTEAKRRIYELMENSRPQKMTEDAYGFAAHGTFNHESEGTLGAITNAVAHALDAVNIGGVKPGRFIVPFTRIITNVVNNSLDFSPVGFIRASRGERGFKTFNENQYTKGAYKELSRDERQRLIAKAAIGITFTAILQALHQAGVIQITGGGPDDPKKKQQLIQEGWHPYSIKVGDKYYSYQYTPLVFVTGFLGNMNDAEKYGEKEDEKTMIKRMGLAASRIGGQVADMTWINSASTFLGALTESNPNAQAKKLSNLLSGTAKGFIPFSGAVTQGSQLYQNIFDLPQKQVNSAWQSLIQDIPIARNSLNDRINALGDPIVRDNDVFISKETKDPVWKFLLDKNGWVAPVNQNTIVIYDPEIKMDRPVTGDEYFEFSKLRGQKIRKKIQQIIDNGATIEENKHKQKKSADELTEGQLNILLSNIERDATKETKEELFAPKEKKRLKISVNK